MIETSVIIGAVVYVLTNSTLGLILIALKRLDKKKYADVISKLENIASKNNEMYELLTEHGTEHRTPISSNRENCNEPYESDPSDDGDKTVRTARGVKLIHKLIKKGQLKTKDFVISIADSKK